ncbi:MAG: hypothetical protein U1F37_16970 [Alphaproteobacteria bacterium]
MSAAAAMPPRIARNLGNTALVEPLYARALVVFSGRTGVRWLRWLKPGYRHCFVAIDDGSAWLTVDPLLHRLEIRASGLPSSFDLASEYRRLDLDVVEVAPAAVPLRRAPLGLFTCVEAAKRLLGIRARWVLTPWQLRRWLLAAARRNPAALHTRTKQEIILDTTRQTI